MFWGEPFCQNCEYEGPNLMWMWHHGIGLHILVQDNESHELRVIEIDDSPEFYCNEGQSDDDRKLRSIRYVNKIVCSNMTDSETRIEQSRIATWEFESNGATDIQCPRCGKMLKWRGTGIS